MDFDKDGHCIECHKNMRIERVIEGKVILMFTGDKREINFLLNDGSNMRITICSTCLSIYNKSSNKEKKEIDKRMMQCAYKGWEYDVQLLVNDENKKTWDNEKGQKYLSIYKQLSIVTKIDRKNPSMIEKEYKKYLAKANK